MQHWGAGRYRLTARLVPFDDVLSRFTRSAWRGVSLARSPWRSARNETPGRPARRTPRGMSDRCVTSHPPAYQRDGPYCHPGRKKHVWSVTNRHGGPMIEFHEIPRPNPEPGDWTSGNRLHLEIETSHCVGVTHAEPAVRKILRGEASSLTDAELATSAISTTSASSRGTNPWWSSCPTGSRGSPRSLPTYSPLTGLADRTQCDRANGTAAASGGTSRRHLPLQQAHPRAPMDASPEISWCE